MKPELREEEKQKFESDFNEIMKQAPKELQDEWHGILAWVGDIPTFSGSVHMKLRGKLLHDYVALDNRLKNRRLI